MTRKKELTGKPAVMKEINISLIVDALQTLGSASRVELCNYTKISQPTVNQLIREPVSYTHLTLPTNSRV